MSVNDGFLNWLAGLIDGEGYFGIRRQLIGHQFLVEFALRLRDDDFEILVEICERLGLGWITRSEASGSTHPSAGWRVSSQTDTMKLMEILDGHPLRTRKVKDYLIWREAVIEQQKHPGDRNLIKLQYLHDKIRFVRAYEESEMDDYEPEGIQLEFPMMVDTEGEVK